MTTKQVKALEFLWFKYGNGGACSTPANHKFIQRHVEGKEKDAEMYRKHITSDCREAVNRVLNDNYTEFSESTRKIIESFGQDARAGGTK